MMPRHVAMRAERTVLAPPCPLPLEWANTRYMPREIVHEPRHKSMCEKSSTLTGGQRCGTRHEKLQKYPYARRSGSPTHLVRRQPTHLHHELFGDLSRQDQRSPHASL